MMKDDGKTNFCMMCEEAARQRDLAMKAHGIAERERQEAYDKIKELQAIVPAQDEDYRYRVEQIAARILSGYGYPAGEEHTDGCIDDAISMARKLVCAVEAMDRG